METKHNPSDHQGHDEFEKVSSALKEAINAKKIHGVFLCVEYEDHKGHDNIGGMWADGDFVASLKAWANEIVTNDQFYEAFKEVFKMVEEQRAKNEHEESI